MCSWYRAGSAASRTPDVSGQFFAGLPAPKGHALLTEPLATVA
jgi:hypothetical protein